MSHHTSFIGQGNVILGTSIMFCNGVNNPDMDDAKQCGQVVSDAFGGRRVEIFHNPTTIGNVFDPSIEVLMAQQKLAELFAQAIQNQIDAKRESGVADRDIRILLFVHSHGAKLLKDAMSHLPQESRHFLRIFGFGGAQMLPKEFGKVVCNFVHEGDEIASGGNIMTSRGNDESQMTFYHVKSIHREMSEGKSRERAIFETALHDLTMHLSPMMRSSFENKEVQGDKNRRYELIFEQRDQRALESDPFFQERLRKYTDLFDRYSITILPGTPFEKPEFTSLKKHSSVGEFLGNLPSNLGTILGNAVQGGVALAKHSVDNHDFTSYGSLVNAIAERYLDSAARTRNHHQLPQGA